MAVKGGRVIVIEGYGSWQVIYALVNDHPPMLIWKALAELKGVLVTITTYGEYEVEEQTGGYNIRS